MSPKINKMASAMAELTGKDRDKSLSMISKPRDAST
jgi:hypothetical protein